MPRSRSDKVTTSCDHLRWRHTPVGMAKQYTARNKGSFRRCATIKVAKHMNGRDEITEVYRGSFPQAWVHETLFRAYRCCGSRQKRVHITAFSPIELRWDGFLRRHEIG